MRPIKFIAIVVLILGLLCIAAGILYEFFYFFICSSSISSCDYSFSAIVVIRVMFWLSAQVIATIGGTLLVDPLKETKHRGLFGWIMICAGVCGPILLFLGYEELSVDGFQQLTYLIPITYFIGLIVVGWYLVNLAKQLKHVQPTPQPHDEPDQE